MIRVVGVPLSSLQVLPPGKSKNLLSTVCLYSLDRQICCGLNLSASEEEGVSGRLADGPARSKGRYWGHSLDHESGHHRIHASHPQAHPQVHLRGYICRMHTQEHSRRKAIQGVAVSFRALKETRLEFFFNSKTLSLPSAGPVAKVFLMR